MDKSKQLRILHVLSQKADSTGSGIYIQAMIREAISYGMDNYLVAAAQSDRCIENACIEKERFFSVNFHKGEVSYQIPGMSDVMPYESSRFCDLTEQNLYEYEMAFTKVLTNAINKTKPDIIHSHHLWIVSSLARRLFNDIPMVTTCHGSDLRQFQNCSHLQERVLLGCQKIDFIMALSSAQKNDIVNLYNILPERIIITGAGYNHNLFYLDIKPNPNPVQLIYAGKLSIAKGVPWLLSALRAIDYPPWHLHLIGGGSGHEKELCIELANKLGRRVSIYGVLNQRELAKIMRQSHILVLPSFYEGLPLVILEGLACGCRIVTTDLPGVKEIFGNRNFDYIKIVKTPRLHFLDQPYNEDEELFEMNLINSLNEQIYAAYHCHDMDLSQLQDIIDAYTWKGVFKKVLDVYKRCLTF